MYKNCNLACKGCYHDFFDFHGDQMDIGSADTILNGLFPYLKTKGLQDLVIFFRVDLARESSSNFLMKTFLTLYAFLATGFFGLISYPSITRSNWVYMVLMIFLFLFFISMPVWLGLFSDSEEE